MEYNFRTDVIQWQISKSTKVVAFICALAFTISEILMFHIFYLKKVDQGYEI